MTTNYCTCKKGFDNRTKPPTPMILPDHNCPQHGIISNDSDKAFRPEVQKGQEKALWAAVESYSDTRIREVLLRLKAKIEKQFDESVVEALPQWQINGFIDQELTRLTGEKP